MKMLMFAAMLVVAVSAGHTAPIQSGPMRVQSLMQSVRQDTMMNMARMPKDQVRSWTTALFDCLNNNDVDSALLMMNDHSVWRDINSWTTPLRPMYRGKEQIREAMHLIARACRNLHMDMQILACDEARMTSIVKIRSTCFWVPTNRTVTVDICCVLKWTTTGHLESLTANPLNWQNWLEQTSTPAMKRLMQMWRLCWAHGSNPLHIEANSPMAAMIAPDVKAHINISPNPLGKSVITGAEQLRLALNTMHKHMNVKAFALIGKTLLNVKVISADNDNVVLTWNVGKRPMVLVHYRWNANGLLCELNLEMIPQLMPWQTWNPTPSMLEPDTSTEAQTLVGRLVGSLMQQQRP